MNCVEEEYAFVSLQRCDCGGSFAVERQMLSEGETPMDVLVVCCADCKASGEFKFDISAFYGDMTKYGEIVRASQIIDALEWLTLGVMLTREAGKLQGDERYEMFVDANFCLRQLLMFYPEDSDLPVATAFFNQPDTQLPQGKLGLFERSRIESLKKQTETDN